MGVHTQGQKNQVCSQYWPRFDEDPKLRKLIELIKIRFAIWQPNTFRHATTATRNSTILQVGFYIQRICPPHNVT